MKKRILKNVEWWILIYSIILTVIGMIALFSATQDTGYESLEKQLIWFIICIPVVFMLIFIDYEYIAQLSPIFYRYIYDITNSCIIYESCKWS